MFEGIESFGLLLVVVDVGVRNEGVREKNCFRFLK
jgi:hypothetical protein